MSATQSELTLANLVEEREMLRGQHEAKLAEIAARDDKNATHSDKELLRGLRERSEDKDREIEELTAYLEREARAVEESRKIRRVLSGNTEGIEADNDGVVYRTFAAYARDAILTRFQSEGARATSWDEVTRAKERIQLLKRSPEHTLSADVAGLQPDQHIAQIFQVIDASRPLVNSATRVPLERGSFTYPAITGTPTVAVQGTEKTVANTPDLNVDMETVNADTYNAGGNLSWQAINWTTPSALDLWFRVAAADYALKTEQAAAQTMQHSGFTYNASTVLDGTDDYDAWVAAIVSGAAEVYANSGRLADTLYLAPDQFYSFAGSIPATSQAAFLAGGVSLGGQSGGFSGLSIVVSRGMDSGVAAVGDSSALLVAETPGAPVELRAVEAQIGGLEVGIIGAFASVVADPGAFALISTAS